MLRLTILIPLLIALLMSYIHYSDTTIGEIARLKQFDLIMQTDPLVKSEDIGILAIDELAMKKYGQWPWSREVIANLVWDLREAGAYEIIIPIIMTEEDRLGGDMALAEALAGAQGVIIAQVGSTQLDESLNPVPRGIAKIGDPLPWLYTWKGMLGPIPLLGLNAAGVGVLNTVPEIDGVVRRLPLFMAIGDDVYPSMAIEVMRVEKGIPSAAVKVNEGGIIAVRVKGFPIIKPDANAQIWLRWNKEFDIVSAASADLSLLAGKKVIIGSMTSRIGGIIASPTGPQFNFMPAAVSLQTLLDGDVIQRPWWATTAEVLTTIFLGLSIVVLCRFAPYWIIGSMFVVGASGLVYGSYYAWTTYLYLIDITMAISTLLLVGLTATFGRFIVEFKAKQQIKKQFEHYLDPRQVKALQKDPSLLKLGGERKEMSYLFMDIIGFTPISEFYKNKDDPVDSHDHTHTEFFMLKILSEILSDHQINFLRPTRNIGKIKLYKDIYKQIYQFTGKKYGIKFVDYFGSIYDFQNLKIKKDKIYEMEVHCMFKNGILTDSGRSFKNNLFTFLKSHDLKSYSFINK